MDMSVPGRKAMMKDILSQRLPEAERLDFREWADSTNSDDFLKGLSLYFEEVDIRNAVGEYVAERFTELEHFCDVRIDAIIMVRGGRYEYGCYNEMMQT
jgi:hypothetical protein